MTRKATLDLGEENERRCQQKRAGAGHGKPDLRKMEDRCQTCPSAEAMHRFNEFEATACRANLGAAETGPRQFRQ